MFYCIFSPAKQNGFRNSLFSIVANGNPFFIIRLYSSPLIWTNPIVYEESIVAYIFNNMWGTSSTLGTSVNMRNQLMNWQKPKCVRSIVNHHCSLLFKHHQVETENSWYSDKFKYAKTIRRKAERTWCQTSLTVHFEIYKDLFEEEKYFYSPKIEECGKDQKKLFKLARNFMRSNLNANLPHFTSAELLADKFSNFFMEKTTIIRNNTISDSPNNTCNTYLNAGIMVNGNML